MRVEVLIKQITFGESEHHNAEAPITVQIMRAQGLNRDDRRHGCERCRKGQNHAIENKDGA